MGKHIFKSTVYHLFHGHETPKDKTRFPIFYKHKAYDQEDWYEHIRRNYRWGMPETDNIDLSHFKPYINESLLYVYLNSTKVRITVCMVSYLRYDILINNLENYLSLGVPINMILWINSYDLMPDNIKKRVSVLMSKFEGSEILTSNKNMGTGYPRYIMINKAYYEYNTDYIMTTDDDILHQNPESLVIGATVLDQDEYSHYGAMGIWCQGRNFAFTIDGDQMVKTEPEERFYDVDVLGAATMTVRRDVVEKCNCDPQYIIGLVDWDFSLSIAKEGWKLGYICDERYRPINNLKGNDEDYRAGRWDKDVINKSKEIFNKKWNIKIK